MKRPSPSGQSGVALVITLILLSVITFLAITFLVLSRRGGDQVGTLTEQTHAKQAADQAFQQASAQVIARMLGVTNGFELPFLVSTNYVSPGFDLGGNIAAITNVNYFNAFSGAGLSVKDQMQMLNNLLILPRAPVFVTTNKAFPPEFRYYLDLNRNGFPETNGLVINRDNSGIVILDTNGLPLKSVLVGDPEWIGVLDHPDQRHSPTNQFIARYAFVAVPVGNSLDANAIGNHNKQQPTPDLDGFFRNQGVGSWEINLAGFLNGLNPNFWPYSYDTNAFASAGFAFIDANDLLRYRYNGTYLNLRKVNQVLGLNGSVAFQNDLIDDFGAGPLMTGLTPYTGEPDVLNVRNRPWPGSDNPNQFYSTQDYFNGQYLAGFSNRLYQAGTNLSTFNRYTYYRMLAQLGTDSAPDTNKINLNYSNLGTNTATNFVQWNSLEFFTNAADRLLQSQPDLAALGISVTNIPLYPFNRYTPAVHRMLQLAANILDATQNKATNLAPDDFDYPSVFRPTFGVSGTNIYINGYVEVGTNRDYNVPPYSLVEDFAFIAANPAAVTNIYGVPWVIGARKGFPNFNEIAMENVLQYTRKLQVDKVAVGAARPAWRTNVQYIIGISNNVAVEAWNSYSNMYPRGVTMMARNNLRMSLTNDYAGVPTNLTVVSFTNFLVTNWPGYPNSPNTNLNSGSFILPFYTRTNFLPDSVYDPTLVPPFKVVGNSTSTEFKPSPPWFQPRFGLNITNRVQFAMVDTATGRVIDYVHLDGMDVHRDILEEVAGGTNGTGEAGVWDTNIGISGGVQGILNQIEVSKGNLVVDDAFWITAKIPGGFSQKQAAIDNFNTFLNSAAVATNLAQQAPYTPTRKISYYTSWQANDPLVHYTVGDLTGHGELAANGDQPLTYYDGLTNAILLPNLKELNKRYQPWGGGGNAQAMQNDFNYNLALKDPLVTNSDAWQFPSNKFASIGLLGRVHRGTPWQTIYMKSAPVDHDQWQNWSGDSVFIPTGFGNPIEDSLILQPTNDWAIFDVFTAAPNDNASRGQLSINQTNFAAWAAVLDGVPVVTNDGFYTPIVIDPNTNAAALQAILNGTNGINTWRTNYPGGVFTRLGDILSVPALTLNSPFLSSTNTDFASDAAYERIPQQILSLLRVGTPRYVIYSYAQSLKPADRSQFTGGGGVQSGFFGMVTNYQITSELVTRTVVRFEATTPPDPTNSYTSFNPTKNPVMVPLPNRGIPPKPQLRAVIESFSVLPPE